MLPAFNGKQHLTVRRVVCLVARGAILWHPVAVMVPVAQPPVVVGDQLRIHLGQPLFIAGGVVHLHHRPGRQAGFGIAFIPVAAIAAAFRAGVIGDQIGNKAGIPRAQRVVRLDLESEHRTDIILGDVGIKMRHCVRLLPGIPGPGLVAGEPTPGDRRRHRIKFHRTGGPAPVGV
ncbi:hypothetical protein D3C71_1385430 [compost metagenome]